MQIDIITNIDEFKALKPIWCDLYASNSHNRLFQSFEWNMSAWQNFHGVMFPEERLYIVHAKQSGLVECEVILPFCINTKGCLCLIGHDMTDVLSEIAPPHQQNWHDFYLQIIRHLQKNDSIKGISFSNLEDSSEILEYFGVYWDKVSTTWCDSISYFESQKGDDLVKSIPHLPSVYRSGVKRLAKKFPEYEFTILSKNRGNEYPFDKLNELRLWMIHSGMRIEAASPVEYLNCMRDIYDAGKCEISCLIDKTTDEFVYSAFRLLGNDNIVFWVVFYRSGAMTSCGDAKYIMEKASEDSFVFDFGTGTYVYKLGTYLPRIKNLYRVASHSDGLSGFISELYWLLRRYAKMLLVTLKVVKAKR